MSLTSVWIRQKGSPLCNQVPASFTDHLVRKLGISYSSDTDHRNLHYILDLVRLMDEVTWRPLQLCWAASTQASRDIEDIYTVFFDHFGEESGMGSTKGRKSRGHSADAPVEFQIVVLRAGHHAVADELRLPLLCYLDRVLMVCNNQIHLVPGLLQRTGQMEQALRLIVNLLYYKQNSHENILNQLPL